MQSSSRQVLVPTSSTEHRPVPSQERHGLPEAMLTVALVLSLWVAVGSVVQAIADGLGTEPGRRLAVGIVVVAVTAGAVLGRRALASLLARRPWIVLPVAAGQLLVISADSLIGGAFVAWSVTSLGLAVVAARPRTVWLCVLLLVVTYAGGVLLSRSPGELAAGGDLAGVVGALVAYPVAALLLMALRGRYLRFVADAAPMIEEIRRGTRGLTPALEGAVQRTTKSLPAPPQVRLTPAEQRVVEGLATGYAAKQLAHASSVSITTIRTHIRHAKRKTGARTLRELAALTSDPRWPEVCP